jgi:hypothetical protein
MPGRGLRRCHATPTWGGGSGQVLSEELSGRIRFKQARINTLARQMRGEVSVALEGQVAATHLDILIRGFAVWPFSRDLS